MEAQQPRILFLTLEKRPIGCKMTSPDGSIYWDVNNLYHALNDGYCDEVRIVLQREEDNGKAEGQEKA